MILKKKSILFILFGMIFLSSCSKVPAGYVGVKVYTLGNNKGVDSETLGVGRYFLWLNEELYLFPTFQQNHSWTGPNSFSFSTKDGMKVNSDIGITFSFDKSQIDQVFQKYRLGVEEIIDLPLKNSVRDALNRVSSKYSIESVYGEEKSEIIKEVKELVYDKFIPEGIIIEDIYWLGQPIFPQNVINSINSKVEADQSAQRAENQLREAEAEAKKKIATAQGDADSLLINARAEAEANEIKQKSITANLIEYEKVQKWDGKLPQVHGSSTPIINMNKL